MVQAYGSTSEVQPSSSEGAMAREDEALLGANATAKRPLRDGNATLTSSVGNLANTIIGSGKHLSSRSMSAIVY